ncbi:MAG: J domain-containing protein [Microbacterium sp.]
MTTPTTDADDLYEILGVAHGADEEAIAAAVRTSRKRWRQLTGSPDRERAHLAEERMAQLELAETTLLDEASRRRYDASLSARHTAQTAQAQAAISVATNAGVAWGERGEEYYRSGDIRNAFAAAKKGTDVDPDDHLAWTIYLQAAVDLERNDDADFASAELVRRSPASADAHRRRGEFLDNLGRAPEAERSFRRAAEFEPGSAYFAARAAWSMLDQGRVQDAITEIWQIIERFPEDPYPRKVLYEACDVLQNQHRAEDAFTVARRLLAHDPSDDDTMRQVVAATNALSDVGKLDEALSRAWPLLEEYPHNTRARLGMLYLIVGLRKNGRPADALEHAKALLIRYPDDDQVKLQYGWSRVFDAQARMAQLGNETHIILNKRQADFYAQAVGEVSAMNLDDSDIRGQVETMRKYHAAQTATKVRLNFGKVLLAIVAALFFLIGIGVLGGSFNFGMVLVAFLFCAWFWLVTFRKQYSLNRKDASRAERQSGIR